MQQALSSYINSVFGVSPAVLVEMGEEDTAPLRHTLVQFLGPAWPFLFFSKTEQFIVPEHNIILRLRVPVFSG